ncbi:MAG: hypothetical protein LKJ83_03400 [Eubacteriaceae bacterium]|jgi:hypothetical protein|nr:hypothetical protein [Eubacteriaceae bacterium]
MEQELSMVEAAVTKMKMVYDYEYKTEPILSFKPNVGFGYDSKHGTYVNEIRVQMRDKSKRKCFSIDMMIMGIFVSTEPLEDPEDIKDAKAFMLAEMYGWMQDYIEGFTKMSGMPEIELPDLTFEAENFDGKLE